METRPFLRNVRHEQW